MATGTRIKVSVRLVVFGGVLSEEDAIVAMRDIQQTLDDTFSHAEVTDLEIVEENVRLEDW